MRSSSLDEMVQCATNCSCVQCRFMCIPFFPLLSDAHEAHYSKQSQKSESRKRSGYQNIDSSIERRKWVKNACYGSAWCGRIGSVNVNLPTVKHMQKREKNCSRDHAFSPAILLDITDVTGQISTRSERIYRYDAEVFARFLLDQGLTMGALHLLTRSHLIAYRKYLGESYAKATASRMFSVARRILQEYVHKGILTANPAAGIKTFPVANETPYTTLKKDEAKAFLKTIDTTTT